MREFLNFFMIYFVFRTFCTNFAGKMPARTGGISAKNKFSALDLHRPCKTK